MSATHNNMSLICIARCDSSSVTGQPGPHQSGHPRRHRNHGSDSAPLRPPVLRGRGGTPAKIDPTKPLFLLIALTRHPRLHPGARGLRHRARLPELQPLRASPPAGGVQEKSADVQGAEGPLSQGCQNMPQVHIRVQKTEKIGSSITEVSLHRSLGGVPSH